MKDPTVRHSYVQINGSFVHLTQYGFGENIVQYPSDRSSNQTSLTTISTESNFLYDNENIGRDTTLPQKLIIFVPGNPGVLGIYHDFLVSLFRIISGSKNEADTTLLAISHNNFDHPDHVDYRANERIIVEEGDLNFVERALASKYKKEPHHIELQVLNKLIILKHLLRVSIDQCRLFFVGHSIGCYVILRLLHDRKLASSHEGSILIHPALENLALTEKGSFYERFFRCRLDFVVRFMAFTIEKLLPKSAKLVITRRLCSPEFVQSSSSVALESVMQLMCHRTLGALIQMAKSELALVKNINTDSMIKPHILKLRLIYAINDHWVNTDNRRMLKELYPDLYVEEQSTMHAFVMDPKTVMDYAVKVGMFIQDFIESTETN